MMGPSSDSTANVLNTLQGGGTATGGISPLGDIIGGAIGFALGTPQPLPANTPQAPVSKGLPWWGWLLIALGVLGIIGVIIFLSVKK